MTALKEQIAQAIREALGVTPESTAAGHLRPGNSDDLADALVPLVKRAQAEAWSKGFRAERYKSNLNGDYLGVTRNPYTETEW